MSTIAMPRQSDASLPRWLLLHFAVLVLCSVQSEAG
jgi:hypothetical protein